ncbi:hypothetical protein V7O61_06480 [Methanolobus sp. WCC1]|uniref:hypothetical protein n=1 Tax=unclassified Methanolobus TaxID=2629569 RepID=UPI0032541B27
MKTLPTWAKKSEFKYDGSVANGTTIYYGINNHPIRITSEQYSQLLTHFRGKSVNIGTSRVNPPKGSVGEWLQENVTGTATASYVGAILIHEGYATKLEDGPIIDFKEIYPHETVPEIDPYEQIISIKWAPSTGEIELEPIPAGTQVNVHTKFYLVTDNLGRPLVRSGEELQAISNLLNHVWEIWIIPEMKRRKETGIPAPYPFKKFIVVFDNDNGVNFQFNEECSLKGRVRIKPGFSVQKGGEVSLDMLADYGPIEAPTINNEPVGYFILSKNGKQFSVFANFRPNHDDFDKSEWEEEGNWLANGHLQHILTGQFGHLSLVIPELSKYDIPFTIGLKSKKMASLCSLIENDMSRSVLDDEMSRIITNGDVSVLFDRWIVFDGFEKRKSILEEANKAFQNELYGSVITLLMSQVEGIITDKLVQNDMGLKDDGKAKDWKQRCKEFEELISKKYEIGALTKLMLSYAVFFLNNCNLYVSKKWESSTDCLSRHGSLHGIDVSFNTRANAIRIVLLFDALYWILFNTHQE